VFGNSEHAVVAKNPEAVSKRQRQLLSTVEVNDTHDAVGLRFSQQLS